jgi:hypothetical protein
VFHILPYVLPLLEFDFPSRNHPPDEKIRLLCFGNPLVKPAQQQKKGDREKVNKRFMKEPFPHGRPPLEVLRKLQ